MKASPTGTTASSKLGLGMVWPLANGESVIEAAAKRVAGWIFTDAKWMR
jgi:hypothetical protein